MKYTKEYIDSIIDKYYEAYKHYNKDYPSFELRYENGYIKGFDYNEKRRVKQLLSMTEVLLKREPRRDI